MKRSILLLALLFAFTTRALATDVTISAMTVSGFSPSNIGVDRSITVSTAGGSPTVTSSAAFPPTIVGLSGFTVRIDGSNYTVASVESTSSLTLTANYAGTPGAQVMTLFRFVELRVYADRAFQPLGDTQVVQPGTPGSGNFFRRFGASVVNNGSTDQLFIPEITIPATTDALMTNQARYTFPFYRPGGSQITFFLCPSSLSQLRLPPATPTTWMALCQFNSTSAVIPPNREAYSKAEIDARLPSCSTNNGVFYTASGNILSCLTFGSGFSIVGSTLEATAGGSGYNRIQEEGANLNQRAILNFIGTAFTCADNAGNTRTDCSIASDLNALAAVGAGTGFGARTAANTWALRTNTGTANEITVTNGNGVSGPPTYSLPAALTFTGKTITGGTYATPTITTPTITGGTHTAITGLGVRSTGTGAFDLTLANTENLTAGRTLTITLNNAARTLNLGGNLTTGGTFSTTGTFSSGGNFSTGSTFSTTGTFSTGGNFSTSSTFSTTGAFSTGNTFSTTGTFSSGGNFSTGAAFTTTPANALTLTTTGSTNVTLPTTGTLASNGNNLSFFAATTSAQLAGVISDETGSGALVFGTSPRLTTSILDSNGNELFLLSATGSAVNEFTVANAAVGNGPTLSATGNDSNIPVNVSTKGTGNLVANTNSIPRVTVAGADANTYFGDGVTSATPDNYVMNATGGSGTNIAGAHLDLAGGKGTGNAVPGHVAVRYPLRTSSGTTLQSLSAERFPVTVNLFSNTGSGNAIANTTTETSVFTGMAAATGATRTLEAGITGAGTIYQGRLYFSLGTTGTPTGQFRVKFNATTIGDTGAFNMPTNANGVCQLDFTILVTAVGGAGAIHTSVRFEGVTGGGVTTPTIVHANANNNIDFTQALTVDVTFQWGTASVSNTITALRAPIDRSR